MIRWSEPNRLNGYLVLAAIDNEDAQELGFVSWLETCYSHSTDYLNVGRMALTPGDDLPCQPSRGHHGRVDGNPASKRNLGEWESDTGERSGVALILNGTAATRDGPSRPVTRASGR